MHVRSASLLFSICAALFLAGCTSNTVASSIPLLHGGSGANLAATLNSPWSTQEVIEGLTFDFPTHLTAEPRFDNKSGSVFYTVSGSGISMFALARPYNDFFLDLRMRPPEEICDALKQDESSLMGIDFTMPYQCSVKATPEWTTVSALGFIAGSEVADAGAAMLFMGQDRLVLIDHIFTLEHLSPEAYALVAEHFAWHPQVSSLMLDSPGVKPLHKRIKPIINRDLTLPSPWIKSAVAFMERIAESVR